MARNMDAGDPFFRGAFLLQKDKVLPDLSPSANLVD